MLKGTHVRTTEEGVLISLTPEEQIRYQARYMWDTRLTAPDGQGGYGYDDASMFRDLERAERNAEDEHFVVTQLKTKLDQARDDIKVLKRTLLSMEEDSYERGE